MEPLTAGIIGFVAGIVVGLGIGLLLGGLGDFGILELLEVLD